MDFIGQGENIELWVIKFNSSVKVTLWKIINIHFQTELTVSDSGLIKIVLHRPFSSFSILSFLSQLLPWTLSWYHLLHPNSSHSWLFPLQSWATLFLHWLGVHTCRRVALTFLLSSNVKTKQLSLDCGRPLLWYCFPFIHQVITAEAFPNNVEITHMDFPWEETQWLVCQTPVLCSRSTRVPWRTNFCLWVTGKTYFFSNNIKCWAPRIPWLENFGPLLIFLTPQAWTPDQTSCSIWLLDYFTTLLHRSLFVEYSRARNTK